MKPLSPTHTIAAWVLNTIDDLLNHIGLSGHTFIKATIYIIIISAVSIGIGILLKKIILLITRKILAVKKSEIAAELHEHNVFIRCSHIIPPLVFMAMAPFAFPARSGELHWILKIVGIYALIAFASGLNSIIEFAFDRYNDKENRKNLPLRGIRNIAVGIVWIIISILSVCILIDKSPATILAGLGAFAAALLLIFKDSILGFVAGIQMSDNDMLRVGDWIIVPGTPANGTVMDVSLSTVKIQNWDLTTVLVPPYTLVSTSFQNYRSMYEAGARLIENQVIIDPKSIRQADDEMIETIVAKYPLLSEFVKSLRQKGVTMENDPGTVADNGTIETNLGLYRAYVGAYLMSLPQVSKDQYLLVRIMQGSNAGIPLQIWCYSASTDWNKFQALQSRIMEHVNAVVSDFGGLAIFSQNDLSVTSPSQTNDTLAARVNTPTSGTLRSTSTSTSPDQTSPAQ